MSEAIQLPAVPTDGELSKTFTSRPDWVFFESLVVGISGKDLFDDRDFGPGVLEQIQKADVAVREYLKVYDRKGGAYWETPYGAVEKAGEAFASARTRETNRANNFRQVCNDIMGQYAKARTDAENEAKRKLEQQQREDDERQRDERLREIECEKWNAAEENNQDRIAELNAEAAQIESTPIIPPVVTPQQAAAAVGLPAMPKGLVSNKKPIYERVIVDKKKFIAWLAAHPAYIDTIAMSFSFTNLKHSDVQIDGVSMGQKSSITNRGK